MQRYPTSPGDRERVAEVAAWCCLHLGRRAVSAAWVHKIVRLAIDDLVPAMDAIEERFGGLRSPGFLYRCLEEEECRRFKGEPGQTTGLRLVGAASRS